VNTYFLKTPDEATLRAALLGAGYDFEGQYGLRFTLPDWTPCENHTPGAVRHDVDIVGVIYEQTGTDRDGFPVMSPTPGFHANLTAHELHKALAPYQIEPPATPKRAPAAATCTKAATKVYDSDAPKAGGTAGTKT